MPTYQYRCKACEEELEVVQAFTDEALTECPSCGGALRKVFGSIGITFKGSGFYKNDSRSSSTSTKTSGSSNGGSSGSSESSSTPSSGSGDSGSSSSSSEGSGSSSSTTAGATA